MSTILRLQISMRIPRQDKISNCCVKEGSNHQSLSNLCRTSLSKILQEKCVQKYPHYNHISSLQVQPWATSPHWKNEDLVLQIFGIEHLNKRSTFLCLCPTIQAKICSAHHFKEAFHNIYYFGHLEENEPLKGVIESRVLSILFLRKIEPNTPCDQWQWSSNSSFPDVWTSLSSMKPLRLI